MSDNNRIDIDNLFGNNGYQQNYNPYGGGGGYYPYGNRSTQSTLSMIFGIASIWMCFSTLVGIALGVMAIVMRHIHKKRLPENGMTKAGLICGIIGIVLSGIILIAMVIFFVLNPDALNEYLNAYMYY
ncbi:MAG: DUF4190 domain-containing protein [Clostridia bacterium]|nr:DUF4190 domain-containing protein [Clostridia bacterium]